MSDKVIDLEVARERLRIIPMALAEAVKPLHNIADVKIVDLAVVCRVDRAAPAAARPAGWTRWSKACWPTARTRR